MKRRLCICLAATLVGLHLLFVVLLSLFLPINENNSINEDFFVPSVRRRLARRLQQQQNTVGPRPRMVATKRNRFLQKRLQQVAAAMGNITQTTSRDNSLHVWVHIPKTAGATGYEKYFEALERDNRNVFPPPSEDLPGWNAPGCMDDQVLYGGSHCTVSELGHCLQTHDSLPNMLDVKPSSSQLLFSTILRDPVERVLSEFYWWGNQDKNPVAAWTDSMYQNRHDLAAWVMDETNVAHNRQALYLLMDQPFPVDWDECINMMGTKLHKWIVENFGSVDALNAAFDTPAIETDSMTPAEIADSLLHQFYFVAVLEEKQLSETTFAALSGIQALPDPRKSHRANRVPVSDQIRTWIRERNQLDMILYQQAVKRLYAVVQQQQQQQAESLQE